jgi:MFS family permease
VARLILRIFLPFALGYFLSLAFRLVNAVAARPLAETFDLAAAELGLLTALYFLAFGAVQLPLGTALDRFGPRRIEAGLLVVAAVGAGLFVVADGLVQLAIGRALIGLGVSACLMAPFKAYSLWVPRERLALVNGLHLASGGLGAFAAGAPSELILDAFGWRALFVALAVLTLASAALIWFAVPRDHETAPDGPAAAPDGGYRAIFTSGRFWRLAIGSIACQGTALGFGTLWVGPWLRDVAGHAPPLAAAWLSAMAVAMVGGYLASGKIADSAGRRGVPIATVAAGGMAAFTALVTLLGVLPVAPAVWLWPVFSFLATTGTLSYAATTQAFPSHLAGRANAALNFLVFAYAFLQQWLTGVLIDDLMAMGLDRADAFRALLLGAALLQAVALAGAWWLTRLARQPEPGARP